MRNSKIKISVSSVSVLSIWLNMGRATLTVLNMRKIIKINNYPSKDLCIRNDAFLIEESVQSNSSGHRD